MVTSFPPLSKHDKREEPPKNTVKLSSTSVQLRLLQFKAQQLNKVIFVMIWLNTGEYVLCLLY